MDCSSTPVLKFAPLSVGMLCVSSSIVVFISNAIEFEIFSTIENKLYTFIFCGRGSDSFTTNAVVPLKFLYPMFISG